MMQSLRLEPYLEERLFLIIMNSKKHTTLRFRLSHRGSYIGIHQKTKKEAREFPAPKL